MGFPVTRTPVARAESCLSDNGCCHCSYTNQFQHCSIPGGLPTTKATFGRRSRHLFPNIEVWKHSFNAVISHRAM
jgi:hypothetical protein